MIKEALEQLETSTELSKRSILNKDLLLPGLVTFLLILPSVLFWYLWMVQSVEVFLDLKSQGNDVWGLYPGAHISILIGLSGLVLFISLFSKKAQKVNKFALLAMSLFGSILVILFLPKGYGWIGLLLLAIAMVYYWLTPWHSIRSQWLPLSKKTQNPEVMQAVILTLTESITKLPYPLIREAVLPLLDELLSLSNEYRAKKSPDLELFEEFVQALSEHIQPVLGALSYRAKSLDNDTTALMVFMERFPPFPAQDRARFNSVESYRNTVLSNQIARDISQAMWLKSALIVADNSPNTLADTLFDIELMLMPILLKNTDEHKHEIALIMLRFVERLENKENKLNVFQQNSWLKLLEMLVALPKSQSGDILLLSSVFKKLSFTQNSFSEGTFQYSAEREKQLQNLLKQISQLINEDKGSILTAESTLSKLLDSHPVVFLEFSRLIPQETLAQFLVIMPRPLVDKFYQFYEQKLGKSIIEEYKPVKQQYLNQVNEQLILNQVVQYLKAANRVIGLLFEQSQEIEDTNFINEEARYETEFENRLNYAVLKRVDEVSDEIQSILLELK
ncbi:MAG: hypothetical protein U9N57_13525, partial [Pseudomonadota bacterium]|nr:hypothetical protein [Pseudomonadota bacterium]